MSGLIGSIYNQAQALNAQSTGLAVAGKNLANVNNPSYSRQVANFVTTANGSAAVTSVTGTRNSLIDNQILRELMTQGSQDSQQSIASLAQSILGEQVNTAADQSSSTGASSSSTSTTSALASALDGFFNGFSSLAADPSNDATKQTAISNSQTLVDQLNYLSKQLTQADSDVATQIDSQTSDVKGLLSDIATLNQQIAQVEVGAPGSALDLRDARQAKLEELGKYMNFTAQDSSLGLGQIQITVPSASGNVSILDGPNIQGTLTYTGTGFTGGSAGTALDITGGSLAGYQDVRANTIQSLGTSLDSITKQLVTSVNAAYGGNFFDPTGIHASTIALDPSVTTSTLKTGTSGAAGANDIATAISDLGSTTFTSSDSIQGTFSSYYNSLVTQVGTKVSTLTSQQSNSTLVYNMLVSQRQSASGVSTDEESTAVMVYQRAYQGNARVINIMDTLLDTVVNSLGHW